MEFRHLKPKWRYIGSLSIDRYSVLGRWFGLEEVVGGHGRVKSCRRVELIPAQDGRQPIVGDAVFQAFAGLAIADAIAAMMPGGAFSEAI